MGLIHCGKPCVFKNVQTSSFTSVAVFGNFISCSPTRVVTAYEPILLKLMNHDKSNVG